MRVAYVCADAGVPVFGNKGCSIHVQEVVRELLRRGASVDLFATRLGGVPPADLAQVQVHELPQPVPTAAADREDAALRANVELAACLERSGAFDWVYERYSLWSYAAMEYARRSGIPGLLEVNAPLIGEQIRHRRLANRGAAEEVADRVMSAADALIAVSDAVARHLIERTGRGGSVHVIPNGVDPDRFSDRVRPSHAAAAATFSVVFTGTMKPWHGLDVLTQALLLLCDEDPTIGLLFVGDGPERPRLEDDLRRGLPSGRDRLWFTGAVPPANVPGLLASASVGVAPYPPMPEFYFSPLKICEYMASGLPVVASRIGGIGDLIDDGHNGLLCPPGDPVALAQAIGRLRHDEGLRRRLGRAARETVVRNHTWAAVVQRILGLAGREVSAEIGCARGDT